MLGALKPKKRIPHISGLDVGLAHIQLRRTEAWVRFGSDFKFRECFRRLSLCDVNLSGKVQPPCRAGPKPKRGLHAAVSIRRPARIEQKDRIVKLHIGIRRIELNGAVELETGFIDAS